MMRAPKIVLVLILGFIVGLGPSVGAGPQSETLQADPDAAAPEVGAEAVFSYFGGFSKGVRGRIVDSPTIFGEVGFIALPFANVFWTLPAGVSDLFILTFSAECQLRGAAGNFDWVEIEARVTKAGVTIPMEPHGGAGEPVALCGPGEYRGDGYTFMARLANATALAQLVRIQIYVKIVDNFPLAALSAWVDDYTLHLEVRD